jgi:hypothetical protein
MDSVRSGLADVRRANSRLSSESASALYAALEDGNARRDPASSPTASKAVRGICDEAKRQHWPPESFLIALKKTLAGAPAVRRLASGYERDDFVARLVSMGIDEYYRDSHR